jgi:hypothetical protein
MGEGRCKAEEEQPRCEAASQGWAEGSRLRDVDSNHDELIQSQLAYLILLGRHSSGNEASLRHN